jgi:hypothetical protein
MEWFYKKLINYNSFLNLRHWIKMIIQNLKKYCKHLIDLNIISFFCDFLHGYALILSQTAEKENKTVYKRGSIFSTMIDKNYFIKKFCPNIT